MKGPIRSTVFPLLLLFAGGCALRAGAQTVAYYRFEEGSGAVLHDTVDGAIEGATTAAFSSTIPVSPIPQTESANLFSLQYQGGQAATFSNNFIFHNAYSDATLEFWLNPSEQEHSSIFWTRTDNEDRNRFNIAINPGGGFGFDYREPGGTLRLTPAHISLFTVPIDAWTHIAITRTIDSPTQHTYRFYREGSLVATEVDVDPNLPDFTGWTISGRTGGGFELEGLLDEVRFSTKVLSPNEFLNRPPTPVPAPGGVTVLVSSGIMGLAFWRRYRTILR